MFNAGTLLWLLHRKLGGIDGPRLARAFAKVSAASVGMAAAAWGTSAWLDTALPGGGEIQKAVRVFASIGVALLALAASARLLRIEEFDEASRRVLRRFAPARRGPADRP
jgi:peptidoglycan biosynthesis protein MviN/MurJ (putative lipid II flippase)